MRWSLESRDLPLRVYFGRRESFFCLCVCFGRRESYCAMHRCTSAALPPNWPHTVHRRYLACQSISALCRAPVPRLCGILISTAHRLAWRCKLRPRTMGHGSAAFTCASWCFCLRSPVFAKVRGMTVSERIRVGIMHASMGTPPVGHAWELRQPPLDLSSVGGPGQENLPF